MPKKKQVTFQSNTPGKYIPRDDTPSASVFRSGTNANRFNSKMVELLASSSTTVNNENEPFSNATKSTQHEPTLSTTASEMPNMDSSHVHSKVLRRRIVNMLETLRRRGGTTPPITSPKFTPSPVGSKSQPITFGQLRQATASSASTPPPAAAAAANLVVEGFTSSSKIVTARSYTDLLSINTSDRQSYHTSVVTDTRSATVMPVNKLSPKHPERALYSSSLEQLLEQHHITPRKNEQNESKLEEEQQPKPPLTVDEILATYYSKVKVPTTTDTNSSSQTSSYPNSSVGLYIHPSTSGWPSPQTNPYHNRPSPPQLLLNEQNRNRPPPPSYSSSVNSGHRPPIPPNNLAQHLIRPPVPPSVREHVYSTGQITQHLLPGNSPVTLSTSPPTRPPPPHYDTPTSNIERSHSALSSINRPNYRPASPPQAGFDPEFSRLLYGKDGGKSRHQRQKRKAFSDPVKKSVEEAGRSVEKTHRRLTTHLNKTDTVTEEEESTSDSNETDKQERNFSTQKYSRRQANENNRDSARKAIVPANPVLQRRIPSFLRVYAQAPSSNDILLQWHLFGSSELESYDAMMKKLYKDENLARVQMYENYRALLSSTLASNTSVDKNNEDDDDGITTTAL